LKPKNQWRIAVEEHYKGHIIVVVAEPDSKSKWKPTYRILAEESRKLVKDLEWVLDYDTQEQAERAGVLIAQKWIDHQKTKVS
jgi:hypothetical protein